MITPRGISSTVGKLTLACVLTVMTLGISVTEVGADDCTDAVAVYKQRLLKLMRHNKKFQKTLKSASEAVAVSAKYHEAAEDKVTAFTRDGQITRKEAAKMAKMASKRDKINRVARGLQMSAETVIGHSDATFDAKKKMDQACQRQ